MMHNNIIRRKSIAWVIIILTFAVFLSTAAICAAADGILQVTIEKSSQNPIVGTPVYLFNESGSYLNQHQTTDSQGKVAFNLTEGNYKIRVDYLGYQFWSPVYTITGDLSETFTIPHQDVTITVQGDYPSTAPISNIPVFLFNESGSYLSQQQTTNANGQVTFNLPEQSYKVRADYLSQQFWSNPFTWQNTTVTVPMANAEITVTGAGTPIEGVNVYVFTASGAYLSQNSATNTDGKVTFHLPAGDYKFRADYQGNQYWSDPATLTAGQVNAVGISTGGGTLSFAVLKGAGVPLSGINCYVFSESGSYLSMNAATDASGLVSFNLANGTYKIRVDYLGYQFWSPVYTITGDLSETFTIPHQDVTITVQGDYPSTAPIPNIPVFLFTEGGSYLSLNQTTNANGQVTFNLPEKSYKVRADYLSQQFWSNPFTWQSATLTVPMADAEITVTGAGTPIEGVNVYVFTASGAYLSQNSATNTDGKVTFHLPAGDYKFKADYQGSQYWSDPATLTAGQVNAVGISTGGGTLSFTVLKGAGVPLSGINCYVFSESGSYLSMNAATDASGQVFFNLANGTYKIRVDYLGYQFWSPVYAITGDLSETFTIPHQDVTITVQGDYPSTAPIPDIPVYLFNEEGSYLSLNQTTDSEGHAKFNLPEQSFKVRADYLGQQFWSSPFTWQDTTVTVPMADAEITVTGAGAFLEGVNVYVFTASGSYLSQNGSTDADGKITFHLSAGDYKFRADYQGSQYWSDPASLTAGQVAHISISTSGSAFLDLDNGFDPNSQLGGNGVVGERISIFNGNVAASRLDLQFSSPNSLGFIYQATYNSRSDISGPLGFGWSSTYSATLDPSYESGGQTYLKIIDQTGRGVYFIEESAGIYKGEFNERSQVKAEGGGYVWYRLDGTRYDFSSAGQLQWIDDEKGNRLTLAYDAQNRLQTVTDISSGRVLTFSYNAGGLVESTSGPVTQGVPSGMWVTYGYDANQNLTSVTYADGSGFNYTYSDPNDVHNLTEKRDKAGHLLNTWRFDSKDRAISNFSVKGKGVNIQYTSETQVGVTDAYGTMRSYTMAAINGRKRVTAMTGPGGAPYIDSNVVRWVYDTQMNLIEAETVGGTIYQYQNYDARGNPGTVKLAAGTSQERVITYTYHPDMNVPLTRTEASVLGGGNKVTIFDYDSDGNAVPNESPTRLLARVIEKGFTKNIAGTIVPYEYVTAFTYNGKGQILSIDGPLSGNGDTTSFAYDAATGDLLSVTRPVIGNAGFSNYDAAGQVGQVTDVNGQSDTLIYDGRGRIKIITHLADSSSSNVSYNIAGLPDLRTDEDGVTSSFEYDAVYGRLSKRIDAEGNYITYNYDAQGNMIEKSYFDPTDQRTNWKRSVYQGSGSTMPGKLFKIINPDDTFTQYDYDSEGNIASVTDPNTHTTYYDFDALNRLTAVSQPGNVITSYGYDVQGNLISVTDAESHETTYEYDDMGRVLTTTSPDTGTVSYAYDEAGNLIQKTDAKGITTAYTYDFLKRLTHVGFQDSSQDIGYSYDSGTYGMGRRTGMTDPSGSTTFGYNSRGRLVQKTDVVNGVSYILSRSMSSAGRVNSIVYPTGRTIDYHRSVCACSIDSVSTTYNSNTVTLLSNLSYRPFGIAKGMDNGSGGTVDNVFDQSGRLTVANPGADKEQTYTYDAVGNLTSVTSSNASWYNRVYGYDALNRLEHAEGPYGIINYTYDGVGNRLTKEANSQTVAYTYVTGTNKIQETTGPVAYTYDANGNITGIGSKVLTYNQNNRLIRVEENSNILGEYTYNGLGQRVVKTANGVTTVFHYDFDGNIIGESDQDGNFTYEYLYKGNTRLALVNVTSGEMFSFLNDRLGTPLMLTDSTNTVVWEGIYKPFGEAEVNPNSTVVNNFRFARQYYDEETGLHYNWHRYYDPQTGRYLRADPIGLFGGINPWIYVNENPINAIDPSGLKKFEMRIWVGASVGYVIVGGAVYDVTIRDVETGETTLYTVKAFGLGVGYPSLRFSSRPIIFEVEDPCVTSSDFEGYGYIGGVSAEVIVGVKVGGGIKVPHGPFIPGPMIGWERGGFDIGVSHSITYWSHQ